jgi:outer membrane protein, multidrug efflux system
MTREIHAQKHNKKTQYWTIFSHRAGILMIYLLFLFLQSCVLYRPPQREAAKELNLPETFTIYDEESPSPDKWWESFSSEELNRLVEEALSESPTVEAAWARLRQAEASAVKAGAPRLPNLDANAGYSHTEQKVDNGMEDNYLTIRNKSLGLSSSYEVDLWGRVKSQHNASLKIVEASRDDLFTIMQSIAGEITATWLDIISLKKQITLVNEQLKSNRTQLELVELRFRKGRATALDIYQQRQTVTSSESLLPPLESNLSVSRHKLAVLSGRNPGDAPDLVQKNFPGVTPLPKRGIPADLLSRRPDIRATGLRLRAADWQLSSARAGRLPALRITASAQMASNDWSLLYDNWAASLAGNLTAPIFDGGSRRAEVERNIAVVDENLANYRSTVLIALREVEDALVREARQDDYITALRKRLENSLASQREALERYRKGQETYLSVLSAILSVQGLERSIVQAKATKLAYRIQLHRSLGGSWMNEAFQKIKENKDEH